MPVVEPEPRIDRRPRLPMSFDALAPAYRLLEVVMVGNLLQRSRAAFLGDVAGCRRALVLGEGPGRFLPELVRACPGISVVCVEQSPRMIAEARKSLARRRTGADRVTFVNADALVWEPRGERFDLVVTHFFLDCFRPDELKRLVAKAASASAPGARWLVADFRQPSRGWQKWRAKAVLALMYAFFRPMTGLSASRLAAPDPFLTAHGFRLEVRRLSNFGLIHSDRWVRDGEAGDPAHV